MSASDPYGPRQLTPEEQAAAEEAAERAVARLRQPLTLEQQAAADRAARVARGLTRWKRKKEMGHP